MQTQSSIGDRHARWCALSRVSSTAGRLDRSLYVGLPSSAERADILLRHAVAAKMLPAAAAAAASAALCDDSPQCHARAAPGSLAVPAADDAAFEAASLASALVGVGAGTATEGMSGADLVGLLASARLAAATRAIDHANKSASEGAITGEGGGAGASSVSEMRRERLILGAPTRKQAVPGAQLAAVVTGADVAAAASASRPSVSPDERKR